MPALIALIGFGKTDTSAQNYTEKSPPRSIKTGVPHTFAFAAANRVYAKAMQFLFFQTRFFTHKIGPPIP
jgi:hypothetical protein